MAAFSHLERNDLVLLIGEDEARLAALAGPLDAVDGAVLIATSGAEALGLLAREARTPDVIVVDGSLAETWAQVLLEVLQDDPFLRQAPILPTAALTTAQLSSGEVAEAISELLGIRRAARRPAVSQAIPLPSTAQVLALAPA